MMLMSFIIVLVVFQNFIDACIPTQQIETSEPITLTTTTTTTTTTSTTTTPPIYGCPDSTWTVINRADYYWCALIIGSPFIEDFSYAAEDFGAECAKYHPNAVVWGIQDQGELQEILVLTRAVDTIGRLGVGARRRPECYAVVGTDATCTALTSFYWTDGYTTGTDGYNWAAGYPDNSGGASDPYTYVHADIGDGTMYDYVGNSYWENGVCGMLPIQLN